MRRRVREDRRGGFFLLFSIVAAMVLGLVLIKFGIPGIGGADRGGIKLSMLSDAKSAISAEITCYSQIGSYVEGTVYSDSDEAVKEPLEGCSNVYLVASPHNTVTVTTY